MQQKIMEGELSLDIAAGEMNEMSDLGRKVPTDFSFQ